MLQLFRVREIPVRADVGWAITFGLITWSLAAGYFPRMTPEASPVAVWAQAIVAAALLFVSVFLHELSHALVATGQGVGVSGITLHIFGGVSELESEPSTPRAEFVIAIVGPLTSFGLAALCFGMGRVTALPAWGEALLDYLVVVNLLLACFNLVPGFPLDGGRVLRATLWWWRGQLGWATRVASQAGSAFGLLLIALGMMRGLAGELIGGLWFVLIGIFLHIGGPDGRLVADAMVPVEDALVVRPRDSAWRAFRQMTQNRLGRVLVVEDGRVVGIVSEADIQRTLAMEDVRERLQRRAA